MSRPLVILGGLAVVFLALQLVPVERTNPPVETEMPMPENVRQVLRQSCYDCHSNETRWPWYSRVAPASWLVSKDVKEARSNLNFSTWNRYNEKRRNGKIGKILEEVNEGQMPLPIYLPLHRDARLTTEDRKILADWVHSVPQPGPGAVGDDLPEGD